MAVCIAFSLVFLLMTLTPTSNEDSDVCPAVCARHIPPAYKQYDGLDHYYKVHYQKKNWTAAKLACEVEGGYLVILNNELEASMASDFVNKHELDNDPYIHIGFLDVNKKREFITIFDEPITATGFAKWAPGEPNKSKEEFCGSLRVNLGLNDVDCEHEKIFVCEFEP